MTTLNNLKQYQSVNQIVSAVISDISTVNSFHSLIAVIPSLISTIEGLGFDGAGLSTSDGIEGSALGVRSLMKTPGNLQYAIFFDKISAKFVSMLIMRKIVVGSIY